MDAQDADQDFSKLNLEDRLTHKNWKARVSGYEELAKQIPLFEDKEFSKISPLVKKFVLDTNTAAQEKGLSAVLPFLDYCPNAGKYVESIVSGTITKCLASTRTRTRELASDVVLMCVEIERQDVVLEELVKGLEQKTPKNVASVIGMIRKCLSLFGNKVISVKPIVPFLAKLLEERDANVREEAKHLTIEIFRWVKDALLPQLSSLKPILLAELNTEFDKIRTVRPTPERLLRSQQQQQQRVEENSGNTGDTADGQLPDDDDDIPEEIDPFELLQPVDIIAKLPNDFYTVAEAKKWQERKDALEKLEQLLEANPKLAPSADHNELLKLLKKIIAKDSNIVVATHAIKCITLLANGLRKNFQNFATSCFGVILDKFKEKKANVVQALREAVDAIYVSTTLEAVVEDLTAALDNKNPSIRSETALFLARAYSKTNPGLINKKLLKTLTTSLLKTLSDSDATVRESSAEALGTALKAQGDRNMAPLLLGLEGLKMAKIEEFKAKVEVKKFAPLPLAPATVVPASAPAGPKPKSGFAPKKGGTITRQVKTAGGAPAYTSTESLNNVDNPGKVAEKKPAASKFGIAKAGTGGAPKYGTVKRAGTSAVSSGSRLNSARSSSNLASGVQGSNVSGSSGSAPTSSSLSSKKQQSSDECSNHPMMNSNSKQKDQRLADEKALKVLKWNFTSPREEFYQQLREQMSTAEWNPQLVGFCFHSDFKYHIKAIDMIREFLVTAKNNGEFGCLVANIDLILKWIALRFFDTNPSVIMKALELLLIIFRICHSNSYMMNDSEANSFLPYLVLKVGDPKDVVRNKVHDILLIIRQIYPATKLCAHLLGGLQSKNSRQRATCLEEIALLIELKGMAIFQAPNSVQVVKDIARFIGERDNGVRNGALSCIVQVYFLEGEKVFKLVGNLSDKEMSLVEERIKRASKNKPPPPVASQNSDSNFKTPGDTNSHPNGTGMFQGPGSAQHHPQPQQQPNNNKFYQSQESGRSLPQFRPSSNQFTPPPPPPNQSSENTQCSGQYSQPQSRIQSMSNLRQLASANSDATAAMDEHNFNGTPQSNTGTFSKTKSASFTKRSFMAGGGGGGSNQNRFSQQQMSRMAPDKLEFGTDSNGGGDDSGAEFADIESGIMNSDSGSAINNQMNYDDDYAGDDYSDLDGKVREALNLPGIKLKLNRNRGAGSNMAITPSPTRFSSSSSGSVSSTSGHGGGSHQPLNPELNRKFADMFTQLSSSDCTVAFQALEHLNVALKDLPKYQPYLENKVDQLIFLCNKQYRLFLTVHYPESTSSSGSEPDSEPSSGPESTNAARIKQSELLFRGVTSVLNKLFNCPLGKRASRDTLRELITHLLPYFVEMKEHTNIFNSVNYFFTILLNGSDSTNLIAALIRMLHDSLAQSHALSSAANTNGTESDSSPAKPPPAEESTPLITTNTNTNHTERFLDITMKFLWRVSKFLDRYIGELNLDVIMFECHLFFKSYPRSFWKLYQNGDLPNRTIKTLIFLIVERKGDSILDNFGLIQNKDESELSYYVQKALRQREQHERQNSSTGTNPSPKTRNNTSALSLGSNISAIDVSSARAGINQENQVHATTPGSAKSNRLKANETTKCSNLPRPSFEAQHAKMPLRTRQINITSEDGSRKQGSVPIIRTEDDLRCYVEFTARQLDFPELNYDRLKANSTSTKVGSLQEAEKVVQACRERLLNFKSHCRNLNPVAKPAESVSRTAE